MKKEFVPYKLAVKLKALGFDEPCMAQWNGSNGFDGFGGNYRNSYFNYPDQITAPLYQQAINFLYICSNKQIDIELKASDTYEERVRKINQGCEDLRNLQNNKSNQ